MKLSIGKAWDETSAFLAREARLLVPVALATFAFPAVIADWAYPSGPAQGNALLVLLAVLLAMLVGQMTVILLATGWRGSVGEAMAKAARRLPALIGGLLIVFLPVMAVAILGFGAVLTAAGITDPTGMTPKQISELPNIGWLLLFLSLFFLIAAARLFPITAIAASEAGGPVRLLKRSWALTSGWFWRLLVLALLLAIVAFVLNSAVTLVVGSIATLAAGEPRAFNLSALMVALASGLVGAAVKTVSAAMVARVYAQLAAGEPSVPNS